MRRVLLALAGLGLAALVVVYGLGRNDPLSESELLRRCASSAPRWAAYQEDIKAQIGADPAAQWRGQPAALLREGARIRVTFQLQGPWARREAALPVLLRDPLGAVYQAEHVEGAGTDRHYIYRLGEESAAGAAPWFELRYPHREQRLMLDHDQSWRISPP